MIVSNQGLVRIEGEIMDIRAEFATMIGELLKKYEREFGENAKEKLQGDFEAGFMSSGELIATVIGKLLEIATVTEETEDADVDKSEDANSKAEDVLDRAIDDLISVIIEQIKKDVPHSES